MAVRVPVVGKMFDRRQMLGDGTLCRAVKYKLLWFTVSMHYHRYGTRIHMRRLTLCWRSSETKAKILYELPNKFLWEH